MASELEILEADIREVKMHLRAFPRDSFGEKRLGMLCGMLDAALANESPPAMSHQRKRTILDKQPPLLPAQTSAYDPCERCFIKGRHCMDCVHSAHRHMQLYGNRPSIVIVDDPHQEPRMLSYYFHANEFVAEDASPRYTFGADYEMDQRWLAAERAKVSGRRDEQRTVAPPIPTAEPDRMMFPTMAFNLTSIHNLNYGTSRY
jgi:hypothetical protein